MRVASSPRYDIRSLAVGFQMHLPKAPSSVCVCASVRDNRLNIVYFVFFTLSLCTRLCVFVSLTTGEMCVNRF